MKRIGSAVAITLLAIALWSHGGAERAGANSEQLTTTLYQGWNLVGWVDAETPVGDLLQALPRLESVWAYDTAEQGWISATRDGGDLQTLAPGMGLWLQVSDGAPITWRRVREPYVNSTMLASGRNVVAWQALDEVPAAVGLRQIRDAVTLITRWDAREQRWQNAAPHVPHSLWTLTEFNHGDAIWIEATKGVEWRQLTGEAPRVVFVGDVSDERRAETIAELERIRELFATTFGGVVSALDVIIFPDHETYRMWSVRRGRGDQPPSGRHGGSWITANVSHGFGALAHEYFHALQDRSGPPRGVIMPLTWLSEGSAELAPTLYLSDDLDAFAERIQSTWRAISTTTDHLTTPAMRYSGGLVATYLLAQRAGAAVLHPRLSPPWRRVRHGVSI